MDDITLLEECVIKEEVCDPFENEECDILGNGNEEVKILVAVSHHPKVEMEEEETEEQEVKTEYSTSDSAVSEQDSEEEELKPVAAVYIKMEKEMEEGAEKQEEMKPSIAVFLQSNEEMEEGTKGQKDPLAKSGDASFITPKETEAVFWISGDPDEWDNDPSSESNSRSCRRNTHEPLQCTVCNEHFHGKTLLAMHMQAHISEKPYQCSVCHKSFSLKDNLIQHAQIHIGDIHMKSKLFECPVCKKHYTTKGNLNQHMSVRSGEKPFRCCICKRSFTIRSLLVRHVRVHTGEKPFQCSVCKYRFSTKANLNWHEYSRSHGNDHLSALYTGNGLNKQKASPFTCQESERKVERDQTNVPYAHVALQGKTQSAQSTYRRGTISLSCLREKLHSKIHPCSAL